jgi:hypothetical protein
MNYLLLFILVLCMYCLVTEPVEFLGYMVVYIACAGWGDIDELMLERNWESNDD